MSVTGIMGRNKKTMAAAPRGQDKNNLEKGEAGHEGSGA